MMKAAVVVGHNDIQYQEIPVPFIGPGLVKVNVKHCGICGSDIPRVLNGACHSFPQVLGHECAGIVTEVGDGVKNIQIGDHVAIVPLVPCMQCQDCQNGNFSLCKHYSFIGSRQQGGMAEFLVIPEKNVLKIDNKIPLAHAALFEPSTVALHGLLLNNYSPKPESHICVFGAGTIALFTLQWCKILGGKNITVIGRNKSRLATATKYGATSVLSTLDDNFQEQVAELTNGHGFDYIYDAAGTSETILYSMQVAANKAKICFIGTPTKPVEFTVKSWEFINRKELSITGSWMSYSAPWPGTEWEKTAIATADGKLLIDEDMIYKHYPLSDVKQAFENFEKNRSAVLGRIILDIF